VAFYAVVALAIFALRKQGWERMLKVLHVVTVASFVIAIFAPRWAVFPFDQWIGFGEGLLLFDLLCGRPWNQRTVPAKLFYGVVLAVIAGLVLVQIDRQNGSAYSWRILITSLFTVLFFFLRPFDARMKAMKPLAGLFFVGVFSYSLYLIHFMLLSVLHRLAVKLHLPAQLFALELFAELAICVAAAYIFYRLVESRFIAARAKPAAAAPPPFAAPIVPERV
jgi:peptidoglycan/LPS O-acetylase OafA/YrhL